ncbi:MAG TPA: PEP-CTERM sorting domain-containing protein [Thiobacillaceae bacterium]|nr:PEP-CTERM sorting domain-containing protein [Thiobacillaceae bacterium]
MKAITKYVGSIVTGLLAMYGTAFADPCGLPGLPDCEIPEPSSWSLLVIGAVGAVVIARFLRK